jgi:hypothetical protein
MRRRWRIMRRRTTVAVDVVPRLGWHVAHSALRTNSTAEREGFEPSMDEPPIPVFETGSNSAKSPWLRRDDR